MNCDIIGNIECNLAQLDHAVYNLYKNPTSGSIGPTGPTGPTGADGLIINFLPNTLPNTITLACNGVSGDTLNWNGYYETVN